MISGRTVNAEDRRAIEAANREREQIVAKYRLGREEGAEIDPWEDPTFEIYAVTDRYGFIHNKAPVQGSSSASQLHKIRQREVERAQKWLKMTHKWEQFYPSDTVTRRVYKGVPESMRGLVWSLLLDLPRIKKEQSHVYEDMKMKALRWSPDIRQIDLDVNRTYRNHIMYRERYNVKQQALFYVLAAYSMYNTEVGYCQGMSQIAALLLMYLNEEDAFWALSALMSHQRHSMHGFFIPGFPKLLRFQAHHDVVLEKLLPRVKKHLDKMEMRSELYTIKWFMQCFLDRVPFSLSLRLWDIFMLEGESLLVAMCYNLLKLHQRQIVTLGMEELFHLFQGRLEQDFGFTDDEVISSLQTSLSELRRWGLNLPPPASDSSELPTRPFGLFVPPSVEQLIGRRTIESERELLRGRHRLSISIPADGGPAYLDTPTSESKLGHVGSKRGSMSSASRHNKVNSVRNGVATADAVSSRAQKSFGDKPKVNSTSANNIKVNTTSAGNPKVNHGTAGVQQQQQRPVYGGGVIGDVERFRKVSGDRKHQRNHGNKSSVSDTVAAPQHYGISVRF